MAADNRFPLEESFPASCALSFVADLPAFSRSTEFKSKRRSAPLPGNQ
ncbi:Uncharacterized protein pbN1_33310 [Aromatoleum bremense]|nr:Uncharacterized protein pbN1_33310 [Aromatoleum bremense]